MSQITLKPLDDGQKAVEIPLGKTTIGRGTLLGCSDKKVSRNHAILEVTSKGEVFLTPTHVNPCFYQPTADSPGQMLKKDVPHKLENGDSFSLLPRAYRYQLIVEGAVKQDKITDQVESNTQSEKTNGSTVEEPEDLNKESEKIPCNEHSETITEKTLSKDLKDELTNSSEKNSAKDENNIPKTTAEGTEDKKSPSPVLNKDTMAKEKEAVVTDTETASPEENSVSVQSPSSATSDVSVKETKPDKSSMTEKAQSPVKEDEPSKSVVENDSENSEHSQDMSKTADGKSAGEEDDEVPEADSDSKVCAPEMDNLSQDAKSEEDVEKEDIKKVENHNDEDSPDTREKSPPKEEAEEEENADSLLPDLTDAPTVTKRRGKKPAAVRQPKAKAEKKTVKRKGDTSPKPRGRKKAAKFSFSPGEEGSSQQKVPGRTSSRTNRQTRQGLSLEDFVVSDDDEWQSDQSSSKPRRKRGSRKRVDDSGSDWEIDHKKSKKSIHKFGSGSESGSDWGLGSQKKKKGGFRGRRKRTKSESGSDEEMDESTNTTKSEKPRVPCAYGKKCYRKNLDHKQEFCHPGDPDYNLESAPSEKNDAPSESEVVEGPKKECPYGENCFRKSAQHKKDFKHTKKVRPQREAAKQADKKAKNSRNSDEVVDSYDLNDSFLNDDSADEYKPVDSGSDYENSEKTKKLATKTKGAKRGRGKKT